MHSLPVGDATLHVDVALKKGRPNIAFINSLGSDLRIWDAVIDALARADVGWLRFDLRGHGLSDLGTPPKLIADHAEDLFAIMKAVGLERATICGVSVGGAIALALADAHPECVEKLVLCCTGAKIGTDESWNQRIAAIERGGLGAVAESVLQRWFPPHDYAKGGGVLALCRNMLARTASDGYIATCVTLRDSDLSAAARRVKAPTLVVAGEFDGSTLPEFVKTLAELIPGAKFKVIAGAAHLPSVQQPEALTREIFEFIGAS